MKTMTKLSALLVAVAVSVAWPAMAQTPPTPAATNAPSSRPARARTRYMGTIASVDTTNMIITLKATSRSPETKVKVTSTTKITKDREPGQLSDAVAGLHVSGSGKKGEDGVWTATTFNIMTKVRRAKAAGPATATPGSGQ